MRRVRSGIAVTAGVVLLAAALAASASAGAMFVRVPATVPLTYAAEVTSGATYNVTATGFVVTARIPNFLVPGVSKSASGPGGQPDQPCLPAYENDVNGQCTIEFANFGELVGIIVDDNSLTVGTVEIGASPSFVAPATGHLFLAANDLNLTYWDNNGQFDVQITPH